MAKAQKSISIFLVLILILQVPIGSFAALDKAKLMKLDPLPSKRLAKMAENEKNARFFPSILSTVFGLAIISVNSDMSTPRDTDEEYNRHDRDYHRMNQLLGGMYVIIGLAYLFMPSPSEIDLKIADQLGIPAEEKEEAIYYKMKAVAEETRATRQFAGITYMILGLGFSLASSNFESSTNKSTTLAMGALLAGIGVVFYFIPWGMENEVSGMDKGLGISFNL